MKRLFGTLVLAGASLVTSSAAAQDIQIRGPLAGARSVARLVRYRENRLSLTPTVGITLQDEFSRELFFGLRANYHFADWIGVGVGFAGAAGLDTSLTTQITARSPGNTPNIPARANFPQQIGRRDYMIDLYATFIPLRGKFALFQNLVADLDLYFVAGVALVGVTERADFSLGSQTTGLDSVAANNLRRSWANSQSARASRLAVAPTFGFGLNFFINRFVSVNVEYRATPFSWNRSGTDENSTVSRCGAAGNASCEGFSDLVSTYFETNAARRVSAVTSDDRTLSFNQMVSLGVSIFLPTSPRIGP
ncbi:MAG: outer membrane beta-barrel domain-containing protein [Deltaproteobacteria bacterium]|nr:outer membrane beta-barrel domain-containing protein [Deltaproteobacteria bacterium]MBP6829315.1 outer membrane beta-barrel domain-containing protein [Deltaproteobacteria bacterium]